MVGSPALLVLALAAAQPTDGGLPVATDKDMGTSVRLVETTDAVEFVFTGPDYVVPSVSIDVYRNGEIDPEVDFSISFKADGSPCFQKLLAEAKSSTCQPLRGKAAIAKSRAGDSAVTTFTLPKREISGDGFGFGFAISLWNSHGNYGATLAGGDYRFGGEMHLVENGPNFTGQGRSALPPEIMPALHRYQGCIHIAIAELEPIDERKLGQLKSVTAGCAAERTTALIEGADALVASGAQKDVAIQAMGSVLDQVDSGTAHLIELAEKLTKERSAQRKR